MKLCNYCNYTNLYICIKHTEDLTLAAGAGVERESDAERLIASLRAARGLGPVRFEALLRRTALLRALVGS